MLGENFDYHLLATEGNNITFYLEDSPAMGKSLMELSKRLAMPGSGQRHTISVMTTSNPPFQPPTPNNVSSCRRIHSALMLGIDAALAVLLTFGIGLVCDDC